MNDPLIVALGFPVPDAILAAIRALDARIEVREVPELRNIWRTPLDDAGRTRARVALADAEVLFAPNVTPREMLEAAPRLKWLHAAGAGVDTLQRQGSLDLGFRVSNSAGVSSAPIAEWVVGAILLLARRFDLYAADTAAHRWERRPGQQIAGKTCGIWGMGSIGRETARRVRPLGMRVLGSRRSAQPGESDPDCDVLLGPGGFPELLAESDFLVVAAPLTPETHHGIGAAEFAAMKRSAFILNVGRGPLIDHTALRSALMEGTIAGAALDVTEPEPLPPDDPMWDAPNLLVTPHVSTAADGTSTARMAEIFLENLRRYLTGEPLLNAVEPERGY